ncbi:MAG: MarR family transcriptional regulator [Actinomycetota bacterium]|nr:MarR family transcriptional regulator [Actinomycetota bacterium]
MDEVRWLSDQEQRAWRKLVAVTTLLPAALECQLQRDADLTLFAYWVLAMLSEAPESSMPMSELADRSTSSPSRLSHVVAKLEQRGWVRRQQSPVDARVNVAVLTDAGWTKLAASAPPHVDTVRSLVYDALTETQVRQLEHICDSLLLRLDPRAQVSSLPD